MFVQFIFFHLLQPLTTSEMLYDCQQSQKSQNYFSCQASLDKSNVYLSTASKNEMPQSPITKHGTKEIDSLQKCKLGHLMDNCMTDVLKK